MGLVFQRPWTRQPTAPIGAGGARGLVACYPGNGVHYDGSPVRRPISVSGTPAFTTATDPRFGSIRCPNWDGTDDAITVSSPFAFLPEFSLLAWVYVTGTLADKYYAVTHRGNVFGTDANFSFGFRGGLRRLVCYARNSGTLLGKEVSTLLLSPDEWHRLGVSWRSGQQEYFINGVSVDTGASTNGSDGGESLVFGGTMDSANASWATGPTFDHRVYNRYLSPAEFAADYATSPHALFTPLPRQMWAPAASPYPVLSAATVTAITATTATPRVTITI